MSTTKMTFALYTEARDKLENETQAQLAICCNQIKDDAARIAEIERIDAIFLNFVNAHPELENEYMDSCNQDTDHEEEAPKRLLTNDGEMAKLEKKFQHLTPDQMHELKQFILCNFLPVDSTQVYYYADEKNFL
jgi:hypothetical protein